MTTQSVEESTDLFLLLIVNDNTGSRNYVLHTESQSRKLFT